MVLIPQGTYIINQIQQLHFMLNYERSNGRTSGSNAEIWKRGIDRQLWGRNAKRIEVSHKIQEIIKDKQETLKRLFELVKDLRSHLEKVQDANRDDREPHYDKELVIDHAEEYARLEEEVEEIERLIENYEDDTESEDNIVENLANEEGEMDELREELGWMKSRIETTMDDMDEYMDDHKYTHLY